MAQKTSSQKTSSEKSMWITIVSGAAGAVLAVTFLAVASKFTDWAGVLFEPTIPDGAVVAFLHPCEDLDGWENYEDGKGKFLIGVGQGTLRYKGPHKPPRTPSEIQLNEIQFSDQGGQETHTLIDDELPKHDHSNEGGRYLVQITGERTAEYIDNSENEIDTMTGIELKPVGKGSPHNNMPPYIAVYFCEKKR